MDSKYRQLLLNRCEAHPFDSNVTHIREILLDAIICGDLPSGTVLKQSELASQFDVSRTPIREALVQLVLEGYVEKSAQGTYRVYAFKPNDYTHLMQFRIQLEALAIRLASLHMDEKAISPLQDCLKRLKTASDNNDLLSALQADDDFHMALINASKNPYVINAYLQCSKKIKFFRNILSKKQNLNSTYRYHEKIIKSIVERNPEIGVRALKQHLAISHELAFLIF